MGLYFELAVHPHAAQWDCAPIHPTSPECVGRGCDKMVCKLDYLLIAFSAPFCHHNGITGAEHCL
jgi:hypothetical protein